MTIDHMTTLNKSLLQIKSASRELAGVSEQQINFVLKKLASSLVKNSQKILAANRKDLAALAPDSRFRARLELTPNKIKAIASDLNQVAKLSSPINKVLEKKTLPNGLKLSRVGVPLGVVGVIYESRPNVTVDVFALCFKTKNAVVLKGGKEAAHTNIIFVNLIKQILKQNKINPNIIHLITGGREATQELLQASGLVDVVIARGSRGLIDYVRQEARVPFIETGAAVCHLYFDKAGDLKKGTKLIWNSKISRPAVCNALDTVLINQARLNDLPKLLSLLPKHQVKIHADKQSWQILHNKNNYPKQLLFKARPQDFSTEWLGLELAVKTVKSLDEALAEICRVNGNHSEAILTKNKTNAEKFLSNVDAAAVYHNAATVFTDGGEFGLGAEVGTSTQKLHARGPMGLSALTSYKWIIRGSGQIRP